MTMRRGLDYSWARPAPAVLAAEGFTFVFRYLTTHTPHAGKALSLGEALALGDAGVDVGLVFENLAGDFLAGATVGRDHAEAALDLAARVRPGFYGQPVVYFAVDKDPRPPAALAAGIDYALGIRDIWQTPDFGIYGGRAIVEAVMKRGICRYGWQTYGWPPPDGDLWWPAAQVRQVRNGVRHGGADTDEDEAHADYFGQWRITTKGGPMASAGYTKWVNAGRPYTLMRPAKQLQAKLKARGFVVYDYPNDAHLLASRPEDHTPFSATGYPDTSPLGWGHALDIMPRAGTPAGLAEIDALARTIIAHRDAGLPAISWLKYMNWTSKDNVTRREDWRTGHRVTSTSTDKGHIHLSGFTGYESSTIGDGYDPYTATTGDSDMTPEQDQRLKSIEDAIFYGGGWMGEPVDADFKPAEPAKTRDGKNPTPGNSVVAQLAELRGVLAEVVERLDTLDGGATPGGATFDEDAFLDKVAGKVRSVVNTTKLSAVAPPPEGPGN